MAKMYVVTGKLGSGKTLFTVKKARDYLEQGRRVATNLDFNLSVLLGKKSTCNKLVRLPDHPTVESLESLGFAYSGSYDENKTGALILDECATWLNARDWNSSDRKGLTALFVHIRKKGWDVYMIIQDISMLDKQIRKILAEHTVIVRRLDRMKIPLIGHLFSIIGLQNRLPKAHMASIFYGDFQGAPLVKTEVFLGKSLYLAYDTRQIFNSDNIGFYSVIPPLTYRRLSFVKWDFLKLMRLTQIYLRKYSLVFLLTFAGIVFSLVTYFLTALHFQNAFELRLADIPMANQAVLDEPKKLTLSKFDALRIVGYSRITDARRGDASSTQYTFQSSVSPDAPLLISSDFQGSGVTIKDRGPCSALFIDVASGETLTVRCI